MGSETMTSSTHNNDPTYKSHGSSSAQPPAMHQRARRKSAKAAAAFVTAAIKEEMLVPPPPTSASKRSYSRGNSQGSSASATSVSASHNNGNNGSSSTGGGGSSSSHAASATAATKRSHAAQSKKKTALSSFAVEYLKSWMMSPDHIEHPYPTEDEKAKIMKETGIELKQLTNWFVNNRKRYWKPKVEELRRQSSISNVTLQEIAAAAQVASPGSMAGGAGSEARKHSVDESLKAVSVSSEGEESTQSSSTHQEPRKQPSSSSNKKRKKSFSTDKTNIGSGNNGNPSSRSSKKVKDGKKLRHLHQPVANPIPSPAALPPTNNPPSGPAPGIHVAATFASVKAARQMSQNSIGESSADDDGEENDDAHRPGNERVALRPSSSAAVSNPLARAVTLTPTASGMSSAFSGDVVMGPATTAVDGVASSSAAGQNRALTPPSFVQGQYPQGVLDAGLVADLDYSISPLDNQVVANTGAAASAAAAAAAAGFCCNVMPHSCNLADPMALNSLNRPPPCALCSACRDWNLGEFCPWDLTGIIGDISADGTIPESAPSASYSSASSSEGGATAAEDLEEEDFTAPVATLPRVASSPYDRMDRDGTIEEATTVTKNSMVEVADVASVDGNGNSDVNTVVNYSSSDTTEGGVSTSSIPLFTIPHEISHSTSAADFISSMVDIESW
mmetsp:Transcript_28620/g.52240  ORF Transcript_28620/g.52240 Transcript_28620/m.52240 type:complete len:675 (-) Transcript_28620:803-2827(-)